jgi:hypothetical protein
MEGHMELLITNGSQIHAPVVLDGMTLERERMQAAKLAFTVVKEGALDFTEGNPVALRIGGVGVFYGFVFSKTRDKSGDIQVVAYDQMRYLKNKDTIMYKEKTAADLLRMIAGDFKLQLGEVENPPHVIKQRLEGDVTLLDAMQNALDDTLLVTGRMYALYDDFGKLALKNVENMKLDIIIDAETAEKFNYTSSIDDQTYNQVKVTYENGETGKRDVYIVKDSTNINRWGVLQLTETVEDPALGKAKAEGLLSLYNQKTRSLEIKGAFGDLRVRGGTIVPVRLNLGDIILGSYMLVQRARHSFSGGFHTMDITLRGGEFVG